MGGTNEELVVVGGGRVDLFDLYGCELEFGGDHTCGAVDEGSSFFLKGGLFRQM